MEDLDSSVLFYETDYAFLNEVNPTGGILGFFAS